MNPRDQQGHVTVLVLGVCLVCLMVGGLAFDGMRLLLERRSLQSLADAAARAGASRIDLDAVYAHGGSIVPLNEKDALVRVREMLKSSRVRGISVSIDDVTVSVELRGLVEPTFLRMVGVRSLPVRASSAAAPVFGEV